MGSAYHSDRHIGKTIRLLLRSFVHRSKPFFVHLFLTKRCNLRCVYCGLWREHANLNELSTSEWLEVIDLLDELGVYVLSMTGGEPLLKPGVFDIIRYANSKGFHTRLTSNGTLPRHFYEELIDTGVNSISISLDSVRSDIQEALSQVEGSWAKAVDTLKFLRANARLSQIVSVSAMVTAYNIHEVIPLVDFCSDVLRCPISLQPVVAGQDSSIDFHFRPAGGVGKCNPKEIKEVYQNLYRRMFNSKLITPYTFLSISQKYLRSGEYKWKCKAGRLFFDIMPDGEFYLCQDIPFPGERNVLEGDFVSWFESESYQKTARQISADCPGCCYSCYVYTQYLFSWRLPDILGVAAMKI